MRLVLESDSSSVLSIYSLNFVESITHSSLSIKAYELWLPAMSLPPPGIISSSTALVLCTSVLSALAGFLLSDQKRSISSFWVISLPRCEIRYSRSKIIFEPLYSFSHRRLSRYDIENWPNIVICILFGIFFTSLFFSFVLTCALMKFHAKVWK